jgi:hypothetical protein
LEDYADWLSNQIDKIRPEEREDIYAHIEEIGATTRDAQKALKQGETAALEAARWQEQGDALPQTAAEKEKLAQSKFREALSITILNAPRLLTPRYGLTMPRVTTGLRSHTKSAVRTLLAMSKALRKDHITKEHYRSALRARHRREQDVIRGDVSGKAAMPQDESHSGEHRRPTTKH